MSGARYSKTIKLSNSGKLWWLQRGGSLASPKLGTTSIISSIHGAPGRQGPLFWDGGKRRVRGVRRRSWDGLWGHSATGQFGAANVYGAARSASLWRCLGSEQPTVPHVNGPHVDESPILCLKGGRRWLARCGGRAAPKLAGNTFIGRLPLRL